MFFDRNRLRGDLRRGQRQNVTGDRSDVNQRLRDVHLSQNEDLGAEAKIRLLEITNSTERILWLLGELNLDAVRVAQVHAAAPKG